MFILPSRAPGSRASSPSHAAISGRREPIRRQARPALATLALTALALVLGPPRVAAQQAARAATDAAPPALTGAESVHAAFISGAGEAGVRSVQMFLDGREVTSAATVEALRVAYAPAQKLVPGTHVAKVVVIDELGRSFEKEWSFEVASPEAPALVAFFTTELLVQLDPLPRSQLAPSLRVSGTTQPGVEVSVRLDEQLAARVVSSADGRFAATLELAAGQNDLTLSAASLDGLSQGPEVIARIERVSLPRITAFRPPTTWTGDRVEESRPVARDVAARDVTPAVKLPDPEPIAGTGPPEQAARHASDARAAGRVETPSLTDPQVNIPEPPDDPGPGPEPVAGTGPPEDEARRASDARAAGRVETPSLTDPQVDIPEPPDDPGPGPDPAGEVVITKPADGESVRASHVSVLGRAPAGWNVDVLVDGERRGGDVANPAGRFTVSRVELPAGEHELMAEATPPAGTEGATLRSAIVRVSAGGGAQVAGSPALRVLEPARSSATVRSATLRVEGLAWPGAQVDVEVNGRVAATEFADVSGHFVALAPLEAGTNLVAIEAASQDGRQLERSATYFVTSQAASRPRVGPHDPLPVKGGPPRGFPALPPGSSARPPAP